MVGLSEQQICESSVAGTQAPSFLLPPPPLPCTESQVLLSVKVLRGEKDKRRPAGGAGERGVWGGG